MAVFFGKRMTKDVPKRLLYRLNSHLSVTIAHQEIWVNNLLVNPPILDYRPNFCRHTFEKFRSFFIPCICSDCWPNVTRVRNFCIYSGCVATDLWSFSALATNCVYGEVLPFAINYAWNEQSCCCRSVGKLKSKLSTEKWGKTRTKIHVLTDGRNSFYTWFDRWGKK
jgi:hypothetical protein